MTSRITLLLVACLSACDSDQVCQLPATADLNHLPSTLAQTGIQDGSALAYAPQFELWSDGASKRRWVQIPQGSKIDTGDMDSWIFPVGTKFWKEFSIDGRKVETRLLEKTGETSADWTAVSYIYNEDGTEAVKSEYGGVNVNGSSHNVPTAGECFGCHAGRPDKVLGFSAVQLAFDNTDGLDLNDLVAQDLLSDPPRSDLAVPGTAVEKAALGYLHANCSHCHNDTEKDREKCFNPPGQFSFLLTVDAQAVQNTETYRTAVGEVIQAGNPERSRVISQMSGQGGGEGMPPLGTEVVDTDGLEILRNWINDL